MTPDTKQIHWLKKRVHHLKPAVTLGNAGLTSAVLKEIDAALNCHELVKIKLNLGERKKRDAAIGTIAARTESTLVNRIGNTAAFFRANPEKKSPILLPKG